MALPNPSMDFTPFDTLPASELDKLVANDQALAAGTGLDDGAVTTAKIDWSTVGIAGGTITANVTTINVTGLGFMPREVEFTFAPGTATGAIYFSTGFSIKASGGDVHRATAVYGAGTSARRVSSAGYSVLLTNATSTLVQGKVTGWNSDGFVITVSDTGGTGDTFTWKATQ